MDVNFIITCFDRERYWPYLKDIIHSYKNINPKIALCYNGIDSNFECDVKLTYQPYGGLGNEGHPHGCPWGHADLELMCAGYNLLKDNGVKNWIKICVDSWLLDETKIIQIISELEKQDAVYAGTYWYDLGNLSSDVFFANTSKNNIFEDFMKYGKEFLDYLYTANNPKSLERFIGTVVQPYNRLIILDREPLSPANTRWFVDKLGWTMQHVLDSNIEFMNNYVSDGKDVSFQKLIGNNIPYDFEETKKHL